MVRVPFIIGQNWSLKILHDLVNHFCSQKALPNSTQEECIVYLNWKSHERGVDVFDSLRKRTMIAVFLPEELDPPARRSELRALLKNHFKGKHPRVRASSVPKEPSEEDERSMDTQGGEESIVTEE